jgi:hypothetical protein
MNIGISIKMNINNLNTMTAENAEFSLQQQQ